ncbi:hypothetical protein TNCV_4494301 [Trichonephila clavipes]|nr:hypothetical protein TNCV_4494301 [Trichonephila clavipes]
MLPGYRIWREKWMHPEKFRMFARQYAKRNEWHQHFREGRESVEDDGRPGRQQTSPTGEKIEKMSAAARGFKNSTSSSDARSRKTFEVSIVFDTFPAFSETSMPLIAFPIMYYYRTHALTFLRSTLKRTQN